jgi:hypothetical protein
MNRFRGCRWWIAHLELSASLRLLPRIFPTLLAFVAFNHVTSAQGHKPTQYDVEAAYLYQFGKFVQWPPTKLPPETLKSFSICVLGRDPFGHVLDDTIKGGSINGLQLVARRVGSVQKATGCNVLFVSSSQDTDLVRDLDALRGAPVLTVSDTPDFVLRGGMVQFVLVGNRVRFKINISNAERAGLTMSSQLLKVAVSVRRDRNPKE